MDIGRVLRGARRKAGLSQADLASRAGTSQAAVARYELGQTVPSVSTFDRLLRACGSEVAVATARAGRHAGGLSVLHRMRAQLLAAARRRGVSNLRVFGSVARGDDTAESDIDLLVDLDRSRTLLDLIGFQQDAERILGMRVDAVAPRFMKDRVRARAVRDARPV
jgi:predicted nucleotidyltransferase/DNA-binding XRE family transcriptional regulator